MGKKKVGRAVNLYDKDTGFVYIVNLYIINYIYYHMKKHTAFIEKNNVGKKPKAYELFGDIINISRTRFSRITRIGLDRFELTSLEAEDICNILGIDAIYFQKDSPEIMPLDNIKEGDWKCFLYFERGIPYSEITTKKEHQIEEQTEKVKKALAKAARTNWDAIGPEKEENPVYQIWYYFRYNIRHEKKSDIEMMMSYLKRIKYSDWRTAGEAKIKESYNLLNLHCEFLKAVILVNQRLSEEK